MAGFPVGVDIPDPVQAGLPFASLDSGLPLLLLPVRVETRYRLDADPPELRIRIYPDQIHIDADTPGAGSVEKELAIDFWRRWHAADDDAGRALAWRDFVRRVGPARAGYLARLLRPRPRQQAGGGPVQRRQPGPPPDPPGRPDIPDLDFPDLPAPGPRQPARPVLLPAQWLAVGYAADGLLFSAASAPVDPGLRTAPDPDAPPWQVPASGVTTDERLAWMFDYDRAVEAGMAITVPLTGSAAGARTGVKTLMVVGVQTALGPRAVAAELSRLLDVHARTDGLGFVPQGTATNNTETVAAGTALPAPPVGAAGAAGPAGTVETAKAAAKAPAPGPRPWPGTDPGDLLARELPPTPPAVTAGSNAARLASALGLAGDEALRRAAFGTDPERDRSQAMIRAAYEAVLGTFVRRLLQVRGSDAISSAAMDSIRDWCVEHVTGGAPYATIRVGPQPYGILPVRRSSVAETPASTAEHVQAVISVLIDEWRRGAAALPVLDPDAADAAGDAQQSVIPAILATQPHPQRLFVRRLDDYASLAAAGQAGLTPQDAYVQLILEGLSPVTNPRLVSPYKEVGDLLSVAALGHRQETIDDQLDMWADVDAAIDDYIIELYAGDPVGIIYIVQAHQYVQAVRDLLSGYEQRQRPVRWLDLDLYAGAIGKVNTALVEGVLHATAAEWGDDGLVQAGGARAGQTAADYLPELRARLLARGPAPSAAAPGPDPQPLLYQLLDRTLPLVPDDPAERRRVADAFSDLAGRTPDELEWLLRETLGLGTHRLDAWATSLASERLGRLRAARPQGLQIGAFGWVTDLSPRDRPGLSDGYVHAPSMAHATTAAMLRSGWLAHGTDEAGSPAAVDVSSARVRSAAWLLDGVRQGQQLGELLGYRFERALHDLAADEQIREVRSRVLAATGRPDVPPDEPVDGIELLDLYRDGRLAKLTGKAQTALAELEDAFDAAADIGLFEAVHQLAAGSFERATAILDTLATGTRTPPELLAPRTPRAGLAVEHRVVVLLEPAAPGPERGWAAGIRGPLASALEAWVGSLLPPADAVGFSALPADGGPATALTLADLELSALDALWLAGDDPGTVPPPLRTLAAGAAGQAEFDPAAAGGAPVSLREFTVLAAALRRAIDALRPADARDLRTAHTRGEPDADDSAALDAASSLIVTFDSQVDRLSDALETGQPATVAPVVEWLARAGLGTGAAPDDLAAAQQLYTLALRRLDRVGQARQGIADHGEQLRRQLAALLGARVPLLATFPFAAAEGGDVVTFAQELAGPDEVDDWLDAAGRVRPDVARLTTAGMLSELLTADGGLRGHAGQSPFLPGDGWAATGLPAADGAGRLSVLALTGPDGPPAPGSPACGLVVDRWSERIPRPEQVTAMALQFDAPSNRPPQSWLLAVTPDGESWNLQLVLDTLLESLEWATLRSVGPEDLLDYGRAVPAVFVPGDLRPWPGGG